MSTARKKLSNRTQRRIALNVAKQQSLSLRSEDVNEPNNKRPCTSSEFERLLDQDNSTTHEISLDCVPSSRDSEGYLPSAASELFIPTKQMCPGLYMLYLLCVSTYAEYGSSVDMQSHILRRQLSCTPVFPYLCRYPKTHLTDTCIALGKTKHVVLSDEEMGSISQHLSGCKGTPLSQPYLIKSYTKVAVNKCIIHSRNSHSTTYARNSYTVAYTDNTGSEIQYGIVQKIITVDTSDSESHHLALVTPIVVGPCEVLQHITFPPECTSFSHTLTMDFVSMNSQSSRLLTISTVNIVMNVFDFNVAVCALVNESEKTS